MNCFINKKILIATIVMGTCISYAYSASHSDDPYAKQYDVITSPDRTAQKWRQDELLVKFYTDNVNPVRLNRVKGKVVATSSSSHLDSLLTKYGVKEAEQLMPLTGNVVTPKHQRAKAFNGMEISDSDLSSLYVIRFQNSQSLDMQAIAKEFANLPDIEYAEPNYIVYACTAGTENNYSSDPLYSQQWGISGINLDKLWNAPVINAKRPVIAILDTGVDIEHPDLIDNIWTNTLELNGAENHDDDGNGFDDDVHGWDFVNQSYRLRDNNGHGTHCAGIAAATGGNGIGIAGANPEALIMPITVLQSDGTGDIGTIIKGIDYAVANGADILSMSFGGYSNSLAEYDALAKAYHKSVLIAAAGNDGGDLNGCHIPPGLPFFPASYTFVLGVMASDSNGQTASFSNWDCDGPFACGPFSLKEELYSYEILAPGVNIISTYPGGGYRSLNGTSMACPLVAGAISRLYQCKNIPSKELLFGDLSRGLTEVLDIEASYKIKDSDRKPFLAFVSSRLDDSNGDNDGRIDAGETVDLYMTIRNFWGQAKDVKCKLSLAENEDPEIVEFITPEASFDSELSSYSLNESKNPIRFKVNENCVDGRHIRFVCSATCDETSQSFSHEFILTAENGIELSGVLKEDLTLYPDKHYIVTSTVGVPEGRTLRIMPGTVLKFRDGAGLNASGGRIIANGEPGNMITFTKGNLDQGYVSNFIFSDAESGKWGEAGSSIKYVKFEMLSPTLGDQTYSWIIGGVFNNCIFSNININFGLFDAMSNIKYKNCVFDNIECGMSGYVGISSEFDGCNITDFNFIGSEGLFLQLNRIFNSNIFGNRFNEYQNKDVDVAASLFDTTPYNYIPEKPNYFGSSSIPTVKSKIMDINHPLSTSSAQYDLDNMLLRPSNSAHGIVWKIVVDGYDAQDEFKMLPDLGVGRHKFEVYFSKPMNRQKTPFVSMGVRPPYTQIAIAEDTSWRTESIDGDILDVFTAYLTIKGSDSYDGLNRIYVSDAEDSEYFACPIENSRFNVNVQSAGSMSAGFMAEAGIGRVTLTWDNPEDNFEDILGYNVYRYTLDENHLPGDTIRINNTLLTMEKFIDYDINPGTTYNYYYKVLTTALKENSPSRVVSATPRAAGKGDANASGMVDVADVVTEVNYMVGRNPEPFMFDAADVNDDSTIDILDVVGTVNIIMSPEDRSNSMAVQSVATYTVEGGILYLDCPVDLAGIQVELSGKSNETSISVSENLNGMENIGNWTNDSRYCFLSFSLIGKTLDSGRQALLEIGEATVDRIILVDTYGNSVLAMAGSVNSKESITLQQMKNPYPNPFVDVINVPVLIGTPGDHFVELSLIDLSGIRVYNYDAVLGYGEYKIELQPSSLRKGFYMLVFSIDGNIVQTHKVIKK